MSGSAAGHFENCFASGLDLSEFQKNSDGTSEDSSARKPSASALRLQQTEQERKVKLQQEQEEWKMGEKVQRIIFTKRKQQKDDPASAQELQQLLLNSQRKSLSTTSCPVPQADRQKESTLVLHMHLQDETRKSLTVQKAGKNKGKHRVNKSARMIRRKPK